MDKYHSELIENYHFSEALKKLEKINAPEDINQLIAIVKLRFLTAKCDDAIASFTSSSFIDNEQLVKEVVTGLFINHKFKEAVELILNKLRQYPEKTSLVSLLFALLIELDCLEEAVLLLRKRIDLIKVLPQDLLVRLSLRLLIDENREGSFWVYHHITQNSEACNLPTQLPWLMLTHGEGERANAILSNQAKTHPLDTLKRYYHYLRSEHCALFEELSKQFKHSDLTTNNASKISEFEGLLRRKVSVKYNDHMFLNIMLWHATWKVLTPECSLETWYAENARLLKISTLGAGEFTTTESIRWLKHNYASNIHETTKQFLALEEPSVFVTSHLAYPAGLFAFISEFEDLHFIKNPATGGIAEDSILNPIYLGPAFMAKSNMLEFHRLTKIVKSGGKIILNLDQQVIKDRANHKEYGKFKLAYNFFIAELVWEFKLRCVWIDCNFEESKFNYRFAPLPKPENYSELETWRNDFLAAYNEKIAQRLNGDFGFCNPVGGHIAKSLLKQHFQKSLCDMNLLIKNY
jgi:hypothetical protein